MARPDDLRRRAELLRTSAQNQLRAATTAATVRAAAALRETAKESLRQADIAELEADKVDKGLGTPGSDAVVVDHDGHEADPED